MSDEREARIEKLAALRAEGIDPYPARSHRTHTAAETLAHFDALQGEQITLTGRLMLLREMGKSVFGDIEDGTARIQIYFKRDTIGEDAFRRIKLLDLGLFAGDGHALYHENRRENVGGSAVRATLQGVASDAIEGRWRRPQAL